MFEILLVITLAIFIIGYVLSVLNTLDLQESPESTRKPSSPVTVRGQPQDETNPREAIYARIRRRLERPEE